MYRLSSFAILAATVFTFHAGRAQEPSGMAAVSGLAMNDLLNVREKASPLGKTLGRLENGALVTKFECEMVNDYEWCRIAAVDAADVKGWAPSRYLLPLDIEIAERSVVAEAPADPLPPAFNERFGRDTPAPEATDEADVAAVRGLADRLRPAPKPQVEPSAGTMPRPTPRPATTNDTVAVATPAPSPAPAGPAAAAPQTGFIPCARHVGQPMQQCTATVLKRNGNTEADVAIAFPDGGMRIIEFRDKKPSGSDSDAKLTFTREGTLNMIRIGVSERFEIVDALPFGG